MYIILIYFLANVIISRLYPSNCLMHSANRHSIAFVHPLNRNKIVARTPRYKYNNLKASTEGFTESSRVFRDGTIVDYIGGTTFLVKLDTCDKKLLCELAGRLVKRRIRMSINSRVKVELDLLYPERGRIVQRHSAKH